MNEKLIFTGALIGLIAIEFARNVVTAIAVGVLLHVVGFNDVVAISGASAASFISWRQQFKSLNELLGD